MDSSWNIWKRSHSAMIWYFRYQCSKQRVDCVICTRPMASCSSGVTLIAWGISSCSGCSKKSLQILSKWDRWKETLLYLFIENQWIGIYNKKTQGICSSWQVVMRQTKNSSERNGKNNQANKTMLTPRHLQRAHLLTEGTQHDSPESTLEFEDSACSIPGA